jgi:hypothetical protein
MTNTYQLFFRGTALDRNTDAILGSTYRPVSEMTYASAKLAHKLADIWNDKNAHVEGFSDDIEMVVFKAGDWQPHYLPSTFSLDVVRCAFGTGCNEDVPF